MKNCLLIILAFILTLACQSKKTSNNLPEIGEDLFSLFQNFNKKSVSDYKEQVITFEEIKQISKDESKPLGSSLREEFKSITLQQFDEVMLKNFLKIKSDAIKHGINWSNISYIDFMYNLQNRDEAKGFLGQLFFINDDNKKYNIKIEGFFDGTSYQVISIKLLRPTNAFD